VTDAVVSLAFGRYIPFTDFQTCRFRHKRILPMRKLNFGFVAALLALSVAACSGGANLGNSSSSGGTGSTGGGSAGGGSTTCPSGQYFDADQGCIAAGVPNSLTLSAVPASVIADGAATTTLTAIRLDASGLPVTGSTIAFFTNAGTLAASSATTDSSGKAAVKLKSGTIAGRATITARETSSGLSASTTVAFTSATPSNLVVSAAPNTVAPAGQSTVSVVVTDANGNPVAGEPVKLSLATNASGASLSSTALTTDNNGQASSTYTAGSVAGNDTVKALLTSGVNQTTPISVSAVVRPVNGVALALGNSTPTVNSPSSVTATVVDGNNNPLQGITVNFQTTAGSIPASASTDSNGRATVTFTAPSSAGPVTIRASASGIFASQSATVVAGAVNAVVVSLAPNTVAPGRATSVSAQVTDANGNAIANRTVQFSASASAGSYTATSANTNASGVATVTFTAAGNASAGSVTLGALVSPENKSNSAALTIDPNAVALQSISLTALSASVNADGSSQAKVRATATGSDGQPVSNIGINFSTTLGSPNSQLVNTTSSGTADFVITAPTTAGTATVTAASGGVSQQTTVRFNAGPIKNLTLQLSNASVAAGSSVSARAVATDANNNPVSGESLTFSVPTNGSGGNFTSNTTLTTANDGTVAATYATGTGSAGSISDVLKVTSGSNSGITAQQTLTINSNVGLLTLTAASATVTANGSDATTLTALVQDASGNPLKNTTVQFRSSKGSFNPASATVLTDNTGKASIRLISDTVAGNAAVTAVVTANGNTLLTASTAVQFVADAPSSVQVSAAPATVTPGATTTLTAVVADANGNLTPGQLLTVSVPTNASGGTPASYSVTTDVNGRASVNYVTGGTAGTDIVQFATGNNVNGTTNVSVNTSQAVIGSVRLALGANSVQASSGGSTVAARATVTQSNGSPAAGVAVAFTTSAGTLSNASATTDSNGIATVQLTPPTKASTATIQANVGGFIDRQPLTVTPGAAAAAQSTITANPSTIIADGNSTSSVTVVLNDQFGNLLPDGTSVTVSTTAGTLPNGNTAPVANGQATFTIKSATTANNAVTVAVGGISGLQTTLKFAASTTGDPASLRLSASNSTIAVSGVGQNDSTAITVTVLDSSGAAINESGYNNTNLNNLRVSFVARPNGGEVLTGRDAANCVTNSNGTDSCGDGNAVGSVNVRTSNGIAVVNLQSGTISGIIELKFDVLGFSSDANGFSNGANPIAVSATLPQISIASGPAASITFTQPVTNAIQNLGIASNNADGQARPGIYRLVGSVAVRDRYDNNVPDGTVINLSGIDTALLHDNTGTTTAGGNTVSRSGNSLMTTRCNEPSSPNNEAAGCNTASASSFTTSVTRNNSSRAAQAGDLVLLRKAVSQDKKRALSSVNSATQITVNAAYGSTPLTATTSTDPNNGEFWVGTQALGSVINGTDASNKYTTGSGITRGGVVPIALEYPANVNSILTGCYSYASPDGHMRDVDRRDSVPQSRQVVLAATAGNGVTGTTAGSFCFKSIAGTTVTPAASKIGLAPNGGAAINGLTVRDGGDTIPLPFVGIACNVSYTKKAGSTFAITAVVNTNLRGDRATGFDSSTGGPGVGSVTVTRTDDGTNFDPSDVATVSCISLDGAGSFTVTPN
jgi:adhesin/invasin